MDTLPPDVKRVMMHGNITPPVMTVEFIETSTRGKRPKLLITEHNELSETCYAVTRAAREGLGELFLFEWGWSYLADQGAD